MSVHQTRDGRWFVRYRKGKNPDNQEATREYFGRGVEAEAAARGRNRELGLGVIKDDDSPTFFEISTEYLKSKGATMRRASMVALLSKLKSVVFPIIGELRAMAITPEVLDVFVAERLKTVKKTTVHRDLSDIRAILRWSVRRRYISHNPMDGYQLPRRDDEIIKPPSQAEIRAIIKHSAPHLTRAIMIAYYTGLRSGEVELLRMTWGQVDLIERQITVLSADKGGLRSRDIPISDDGFLKLLHQWLEQDREMYKKTRDRYKRLQDIPLITFCGRPITSLKTSWNAAKARAMITRRLRMYDIRHAFATMLLEEGADLKHVSSMLGHKTIQQTVDTYQHASMKLREQAIKKLPSITDDSSGNT